MTKIHSMARNIAPTMLTRVIKLPIPTVKSRTGTKATINNARTSCNLRSLDRISLISVPITMYDVHIVKSPRIPRIGKGRRVPPTMPETASVVTPEGDRPITPIAKRRKRL